MAAGLLLAAALGAYLAAARRVPRRWPPVRTACFAAGAAAGLAALSAGGGGFAGHAGRHLVLGMVSPALLVLGAPVTLGLQATGQRRRRRLLAVLHSRPAAALAHPLVAWGLFGGSLAAVYLTPLFRLAAARPWLEEALHVHFLATGALFSWLVLGADPAPRPLHHGARLLMVFLTIPFHAVVGLALLAARVPLAPGITLADHRAGTAVLWGGGDLLGLVATLAVAARWMADEERRAAGDEARGGGAVGPAPG